MPLADLSSADKKALEKIKLALGRREKNRQVQFLAVTHQGQLLFVHEHDLGLGKTPHQTVRDVFAARHPELYAEQIKPQLEPLELLMEGEEG